MPDGGDLGVVGEEDHAGDAGGVALQVLQQFFLVDAPDLHQLVRVAGNAGHHLAVLAEGDGVGVAAVGAEVFDLLAIGDIPQAHALVGAGAGEGLAIGREGDTIDDLGVALDLADELGVGGVPEADGLVDRACGDQFAIEGEGGAVNRAGVAGQHFLLLGLRPTPQLGGVVEAGRNQGFAIGREGEVVDGSRVGLPGVGLCHQPAGAGEQAGEKGQGELSRLHGKPREVNLRCLGGKRILAGRSIWFNRVSGPVQPWGVMADWAPRTDNADCRARVWNMDGAGGWGHRAGLSIFPGLNGHETSPFALRAFPSPCMERENLYVEPLAGLCRDGPGRATGASRSDVT
ncbi:MAG: hypothetical protein LW700_11390 [Gemmataceae bacterium]|nr:hypothetical protein [Gemmataceae bacterium]